jgi:DeoR/GlpR family transcriptional regulator of sugar metabolism
MGSDNQMIDRSTNHDMDRTLRILTALDEEGPCHVMDLATVLDEHPIPIDRTCGQLQQDGQLRRRSGGVYEITDVGVSMLENTPSERASYDTA